MDIYKFIVKGVRKNFMEPDTHETMEYFLRADSFQQAHTELCMMLKHGGWTAKEIQGKAIIVIDVRENKEAE